jgi:hypothetical protein
VSTSGPVRSQAALASLRLQGELVSAQRARYTDARTSTADEGTLPTVTQLRAAGGTRGNRGGGYVPGYETGLLAGGAIC